mgnify:CR=1 FL=1
MNNDFLGVNIYLLKRIDKRKEFDGGEFIMINCCSRNNDIFGYIEKEEFNKINLSNPLELLNFIINGKELDYSAKKHLLDTVLDNNGYYLSGEFIELKKHEKQSLKIIREIIEADIPFEIDFDNRKIIIDCERKADISKKQIQDSMFNNLMNELLLLLEE